MAEIFVALAGLIHVYIFVMESILWGAPRMNKVFRVSPNQAKENRLFAFNQGFYNLFLAIAALLGVYLAIDTAQFTVAMTLMVYSSLSMLGASLILAYSERKMISSALIQGLPPGIGLLLLWLGMSR